MQRMPMKTRLMKHLLRVAVLLGMASALAACDKCGEPLTPFGLPKSCGDSKPNS